jgi:hypothetical protein
VLTASSTKVECQTRVIMGNSFSASQQSATNQRYPRGMASALSPSSSEAPTATRAVRTCPWGVLKAESTATVACRTRVIMGTSFSTCHPNNVQRCDDPGRVAISSPNDRARSVAWCQAWAFWLELPDLGHSVDLRSPFVSRVLLWPVRPASLRCPSDLPRACALPPFVAVTRVARSQWSASQGEWGVVGRTRETVVVVGRREVGHRDTRRPGLGEASLVARTTSPDLESLTRHNRLCHDPARQIPSRDRNLGDGLVVLEIGQLPSSHLAQSGQEAVPPVVGPSMA